MVGGKETTGLGKGSVTSNGDEIDFYCRKLNHWRAECRKLKADIAVGRGDAKGKPIATDGTAQQINKSFGAKHHISAITFADTTPQIGVSCVDAGLGVNSSYVASPHKEHWFIAPVTVSTTGTSTGTIPSNRLSAPRPSCSLGITLSWTAGPAS